MTSEEIVKLFENLIHGRGGLLSREEALAIVVAMIAAEGVVNAAKVRQNRL